MEVFVLALVAQLVVTRHHGLELLGVQARLLGQVVQRVGLVVRAVLHAGVPHGNQFLGRERGQRVVHAERVPLMTLFKDGLRIVGRPDAEGDMPRL